MIPNKGVPEGKKTASFFKVHKPGILSKKKDAHSLNEPPNLTPEQKQIWDDLSKRSATIDKVLAPFKKPKGSKGELSSINQALIDDQLFSSWKALRQLFRENVDREKLALQEKSTLSQYQTMMAILGKQAQKNPPLSKSQLGNGISQEDVSYLFLENCIGRALYTLI